METKIFSKHSSVLEIKVFPLKNCLYSVYMSFFWSKLSNLSSSSIRSTILVKELSSSSFKHFSVVQNSNCFCNPLFFARLLISFKRNFWGEIYEENEAFHAKTGACIAKCCIFLWYFLTLAL